MGGRLTVEIVKGVLPEESSAGEETVDNLLSTLGRTTDAMVAVDDKLRIVGWNEAATDLFGLPEEEAIGKSCYDVMCWTDRVGNPVCLGCDVEPPGADGELTPTREVMGTTADGKNLWLSATTVTPPPEIQSRCRVVHLVREVSLPPELERLVVERLGANTPAGQQQPTVLSRLTPREREVLKLLTEGLDGNAIAEKLYLSQATVRNHIQHILNKLEVHSRTEAVALALRNGQHA